MEADFDLIPVLVLSDFASYLFPHDSSEKGVEPWYLKGFFQDAKGGKENNQSRLSVCQLWVFHEKFTEVMTFPADLMPTAMQ